jgi:hypothetical protein
MFENAFKRVILSEERATNKIKRIFKDAFKPRGIAQIWTPSTFAPPPHLLSTSTPAQHFRTFSALFQNQMLEKC